MTTLIIDSRENHILSQIKIPHKIETLDVGDFMFVSDKPLMVIERKTISDLDASITDGRYHEQKARLLQFALENPGCKISYLIELNTIEFNTKIIGAITNTQLRDNIPCLISNSINCTINILKSIQKNMDIYTEKTNTDKRYTQNIKIKKKDNISNKVCFTLQLMQIPLISESIASIFSDKYDNMNMFITHLKIDKDKVFNNIPNFGPVKKQKLLSYLGLDDDYIVIL